MRLTFLTALYSSYVEAFYRDRPRLAQQSYAEQKSALDRDGFAWNGAWEPALGPLGYQVHSIYSNVEPLQRAWAAENGVAWPAIGWIEQVARHQLQSFRPEVLFVDQLTIFRRPWLNAARAACPGLCRILGFAGVYLSDFETLRVCDAVFSCAVRPVKYFRDNGARAFLLRHAFNPALLARLPTAAAPVNELIFAGSIARGAGSHLEREQLIEALVQAVPVSIHCPQSETAYSLDWVRTNARRGLYATTQLLRRAGVAEASLHRLPGIGRAANWTGWPLSQVNPRLRPRMKPPYYGIAMLAALRDHAVTLNKHIDMAFAEAGNARLFEATGVGACLLTDWKANLGEMFEPDREVAVYRSNEECVEKVRWLLAHPTEAKALAAAGQARTLREHTFVQRAVELDQLIKAQLL